MKACSDSSVRSRRAGPPLAQHLGQLQPAHEQVVEVPQPVADEGLVGRVQQRPDLGCHDHAVAALLEIAGIDQDADHAQCG